MDDVILVRCGRDVQLKSFISLVEEDGGTFSEGRCELKGESNSKSELNTTGYETEPTELWMLADNGQLLKVADINRVMQIDELKITKESRRCGHMSCELSDNGVVSVEGQVLQLATSSATKCVVQTEYVAELA